MVQMVDSQQQELSPEDIVAIASMNTDAGVDRAKAIAMINAELQMDDTLFIRQGNTLFIIHKAAPGIGWFRALNADTAPNFLANSVEFIKACYKMGFDTMASTFDDPAIISVFRYISKNPPNPDMGYEIETMDDGSFMGTIKTGPSRGGAA
jgi:hypothetical protein